MPRSRQSDGKVESRPLGTEHVNGICYSGYRDGQSPVQKVFPTYDQIFEDLTILERKWNLLRLYDCSRHAEIVLEVIEREKLDLKVMLGADIAAEENNRECPWGGVYPQRKLMQNKVSNRKHIEKLIRLANTYPDIIFSLSAGNEATVSWTDHSVPVEAVVQYVNMIRDNTRQPVTFCENYVPWQSKLEGLADTVDFISIHTYPVWEYKSIGEALDYTIQNYRSVAEKYSHKEVVITEAGWTTHSNGRGIDPKNVSEGLQTQYYHELTKWCKNEGILLFVFEAFDESWKGSVDRLEPEKHWGLFTIDRKPKAVMAGSFPELA